MNVSEMDEEMVWVVPKGSCQDIRGFWGEMNPLPGCPLQSTRNKSPTYVTCDFRGITKSWVLRILPTPSNALVFPLPWCVILITRTLSIPLVTK